MVDQINSMAGLLYELAAERYAANTNRNQKWILTTHDGMEILKFTDKKHTVVSLPAFLPNDAIALSLYAAHYNALSERAADLKAKAGNYDEPIELYRLLLHFDRSDTKERRKKKLALLQKLKRGEDVETTTRQFMELSDDLGTLINFHQLERITPAVVTNLLEVRLP